MQLRAFVDAVKFDTEMHTGVTRKIAKIQVRFEYEGKEYFETSTHAKGDGYHFIWVKYINKEVDILFFPTGGDVFILKPYPSERSIEQVCH